MTEPQPMTDDQMAKWRASALRCGCDKTCKPVLSLLANVDAERARVDKMEGELNAVLNLIESVRGKEWTR